MHCGACVVLTENELMEHPKVSSARSNLKTRSVEICGDFGNMTLRDIAKELTGMLSQHSLSTDGLDPLDQFGTDGLAAKKQKRETNRKEFIIAILIAFGFAFLFALLQRIGIVNLVSVDNITYGVAFVIGIIASLSTCMAVVGGLVLSMSATFARQGDTARPQILFHIGRLVSFFILGGAIGAVGSAFQLGTTGTFALGMIIGLVMLTLGINLLDMFPWTKRLQPSMPKFLSRKILDVKKMNHTLTPTLVGIATFFLPCGFTQSMQIYTLTTGNFLQGGLTMLSFALGTLPVLALVGLSSFSIQNKSQAGIFFKSAGLIVILFALFNIINSLAAMGWIAPVFNF